MERASRLILIASIVVAGATHAWLAIWHPALPAAAASAFAITFLLARVSLTAALVPIFATMWMAPTLLSLAFGLGDYHLMLVWLAALAGPVLAHSDLEEWHLPSRWMIPLVGWALVLACTWPIVALREIDFSLVAARTYDTRNAMFNAPPRVAAAWIVIVALAQMLGILWIDLLYARFSGAESERAERSVMVPILASVAIGAAVGLYQVFDINWMNPPFWANLQRPSGLMQDANTFGIGCAIWAPVATVLGWRLRWPVWIGLALYLLLAAGALASGSRTALLALGAGTAGLLVAFAQRRGWWQPRLAPILFLLGAAALVLAMFVAPRGGNSPNPIIRVFDRLPRFEVAEFRRFADEMWTRFGYGRAAVLMIADHPLTGVGIGAFHVVAPDYIYRDKGRTLVSDNAQNWWRHQVAELGFLGGLPSLWMSLVLVVLLWRGGPYVEPFGATTVLRTVLAGVGLASLLGVPTQHPATWLSFATIAFWLAAMFAVNGTPVARGWWMAAIAVAVLTAAGQAASARDDLRVPVRALEDGVPYRYGFTPPEGVSEFGELRWAARRAVDVMPVKERWLQVALWAPQPDVATTPITVRVWINRRRVIEESINTSKPVMHIVKMPDDAAWVMLEVSASRALDRERALRIAHQWLRELPRHVAPDRVIR